MYRSLRFFLHNPFLFPSKKSDLHCYRPDGFTHLPPFTTSSGYTLILFYRHLPQINPQMYYVILASAPWRTQINTNATESGLRKQTNFTITYILVGLELVHSLNSGQRGQIDGAQLVSGTRQQLMLSFVVSWENTPVEGNVIVDAMVLAFGICGKIIHTIRVELTDYC